MNAQIFQYQNSPVEFRLIDGEVYANATEMCRPFGKKVSHFLQLPNTIAYMDALRAMTDNPPSLIISEKGGNVRGGGQTMIHQKLILRMAAWLDVRFEIWCDERIAELLRTGQTSLAPEPTVSDPSDLSRFTKREVQIDNSKQVNRFFFAGGQQKVIDYNRQNCYRHTGRLPHEILAWAKRHRVPSKFRTSAKGFIRAYRPAVACSMALADEFCKTGRMEIAQAADLCKTHALPIFQQMQQLGLISAIYILPERKG
jgi:KilA-N domain